MKWKVIEMLETELGCSITELKEGSTTTYINIEAEKIPEACLKVKNNSGGVLVSMFAVDESTLGNGFTVYYTFAFRKESRLLALKALISVKNSEAGSIPEALILPSISREIPSAGLYEREIQEMFGISFKNHPDSRRLVLHENWPEGHYPLRKKYDVSKKPQFTKGEYKFARVEGTGVFEIPVGPVHAGIIEPGHFRFSVAGEPIINLEAQLGYVHKGIEKLSENQDFNKVLFISERISGDETVSNSLAYSQAVESIAELAAVPERALYIRTILCELERIYNHLGDIAGICTDVAYSFAAYQFNMMRRWQMILNEELTGSRILRSSIKPGGVRKDCIKGKEAVLLEALDKLEKEFTETVDIMKSNNLFIDRVEHTGVIKPEIAADLNAVGPAARSAGIDIDIRRDFPYAAYDRLNFNVSVHHNGDVCCRMNVKIEEFLEAIKIIRLAVKEIGAEGSVFEPIEKLEPYKAAFGITESPRGENIHWVMSGEGNTIFRYKIRTPSFCNWPVLCHAVKGNVIPDFPLVNKSFNLSYSGNDL